MWSSTIDFHIRYKFLFFPFCLKYKLAHCHFCIDLCYSGIGCGISMLCLGTYMYFKYQWDQATPPIPPMYSWIPVLCIFTFTMTCTLGFLVVPWVMIGEIYPQKIRGLIGGFTTCAAHIFVFLVVKTYPMMAYAINEHGTFLLYGAVSLLGKFIIIYLPLK